MEWTSNSGERHPGVIERVYSDETFDIQLDDISESSKRVKKDLIRPISDLIAPRHNYDDILRLVATELFKKGVACSDLSKRFEDYDQTANGVILTSELASVFKEVVPPMTYSEIKCLTDNFVSLTNRDHINYPDLIEVIRVQIENMTAKVPEQMKTPDELVRLCLQLLTEPADEGQDKQIYSEKQIQSLCELLSQMKVILHGSDNNDPFVWKVDKDTVNELSANMQSVRN